MILTRREVPVLIVNLIYIPFFSYIALGRKNYEFLLYALIVLLVGALVVWKQRRVRFDLSILWGLTVWGLMHMAGGNIQVADGVLYSAIVVPIWPALHILRYDQVVHVLGFGVATLVCYHLLRPYLRETPERWGTLGFLVVLMGCGVGAINEIIEFITVLTLPETYVGGYDNTMLDLCFNLLGGILAVFVLGLRRRRAE